MHASIPATTPHDYPSTKSYSAATKTQPCVNSPTDTAQSSTFQHTSPVCTQEQLQLAKQHYWEKPRDKQPQSGVCTTTTVHTAKTTSPATTMSTSSTPSVAATSIQSARQQPLSPMRTTAADGVSQKPSPLRANSVEKKSIPDQKPEIISDLSGKETPRLVKYGKIKNYNDDGM